MTSDPRVTIVIPTRNRRGLLAETIASVVAQTVGDWELIVVDDASEDETWPWLAALRDPRVRPIRLEQPSERAKARNAGLVMARAPLILFLDDDDLLPRRALDIHLAGLARASGAIASVGGYLLRDERGSPVPVPIVRRPTVRAVWRDVLFGWMATYGQSLFRTDCIRSVNGWAESYIPVEDHDLWLRVGQLGPVALQPEIVLVYRLHAGQWRPPNVEQMMTELREHAVARTQGKERVVAEGVLRARTAARKLGNGDARRGGGVTALIAYVRALIAVPGLLRSPLTRRKALKPILTYVIGHMGVRLAEGCLVRARRLYWRRIEMPGRH